MTKLARFLKDESGLIAAGIGVAIVVIVFEVGTALTGIFQEVENKLTSG
jgi:Flp pilus assembly pilin Flp